MLTIGIDEAGRGCWAGPLVAAAVVLQRPIAGLADSKKLSASRRQTLARQIYEYGQVGYGLVDPGIIDQVGLTKATSQAMLAAVDCLLTSLSQPYEIIIDGHINYLSHLPAARCLIKADATVPAVSAASIIAKTVRDDYMRQLAVSYPAYGFDRHVGYGTAYHRQQLAIHGVSPIHRLSYRPVSQIAGMGHV